MKDTKVYLVLGTLAAIVVLSLATTVILSLSIGYFISNQRTAVAETASSSSEAPINTQATPNSAEINFPPLAQATAPADAAQARYTWQQEAVTISLRLLFAVIFSAILAFRPRKNIPLFQRNLYVAQTQILLAVVAAALMMIVGDNAARAFAIFAAVSLVRFRTNIRDPKEITVLLISLALGLAAGVGRWDLGLVLCLFALGLLYLLEQNEPDKVFRAMALTVKTRDTETTQSLLKGIFQKYKLDAEVRQIDPPDETNAVGCIMYYLNLRLSLSTDQLSDKIISLDPDNIEGIEWEQKKDASYIYQ